MQTVINCPQSIVISLSAETLEEILHNLTNGRRALVQRLPFSERIQFEWRN